MTSPTLGQARGKIVLMTRVDMSGAGESSLYSYTGPDLTKWDDSYKDRNHYAQRIESESKVSVYIQDDYSSPDDNKKRQVFNTVYQLYRRKLQDDPALANAETLLFMPDLLGYFLRLDTGFLLSPIKDRDTEADGNTRILRRVIINLFQMSVITDQTERESNISLELVQSLRLNHIES